MFADPSSPQSGLPEPSHTGAFTAYVSFDIDAPIAKVWAVLADFTKYPDWNPFVRSQVIVDKSKKPLEDQTPGKGKYLLLQTHIPPTMDDSVSTTETFEQITHFDDVEYRMAWINLMPSWFITAERWQALSTTEDGKTRYESREVFGGIGGYLIKWFLSGKLMMSYNAMGEALQARCKQ